MSAVIPGVLTGIFGTSSSENTFGPGKDTGASFDGEDDLLAFLSMDDGEVNALLAGLTADYMLPRKDANDPLPAAILQVLHTARLHEFAEQGMFIHKMDGYPTPRPVTEIAGTVILGDPHIRALWAKAADADRSMRALLESPMGRAAPKDYELLYPKLRSKLATINHVLKTRAIALYEELSETAANDDRIAPTRVALREIKAAEDALARAHEAKSTAIEAANLKKEEGPAAKPDPAVTEIFYVENLLSEFSKTLQYSTKPTSFYDIQVCLSAARAKAIKHSQDLNALRLGPSTANRRAVKDRTARELLEYGPLLEAFDRQITAAAAADIEAIKDEYGGLYLIGTEPSDAIIERLFDLSMALPFVMSLIQTQYRATLAGLAALIAKGIGPKGLSTLAEAHSHKRARVPNCSGEVLRARPDWLVVEALLCALDPTFGGLLRLRRESRGVHGRQWVINDYISTQQATRQLDETFDRAPPHARALADIIAPMALDVESTTDPLVLALDLPRLLLTPVSSVTRHDVDRARDMVAYSVAFSKRAAPASSPKPASAIAASAPTSKRARQKSRHASSSSSSSSSSAAEPTIAAAAPSGKSKAPPAPTPAKCATPCRTDGCPNLTDGHPKHVFCSTCHSKWRAKLEAEKAAQPPAPQQAAPTNKDANAAMPRQRVTVGAPSVAMLEPTPAPPMTHLMASLGLHDDSHSEPDNDPLVLTDGTELRILVVRAAGTGDGRPPAAGPAAEEPAEGYASQEDATTEWVDPTMPIAQTWPASRSPPPGTLEALPRGTLPPPEPRPAQRVGPPRPGDSPYPVHPASQACSATTDPVGPAPLPVRDASSRRTHDPPIHGSKLWPIDLDGEGSGSSARAPGAGMPPLGLGRPAISTASDPSEPTVPGARGVPAGSAHTTPAPPFTRHGPPPSPPPPSPPPVAGESGGEGASAAPPPPVGADSPGGGDGGITLPPVDAARPGGRDEADAEVLPVADDELPRLEPRPDYAALRRWLAGSVLTGRDVRDAYIDVPVPCVWTYSMNPPRARLRALATLRAVPPAAWLPAAPDGPDVDLGDAEPGEPAAAPAARPALLGPPLPPPDLPLIGAVLRDELLPLGELIAMLLDSGAALHLGRTSCLINARRHSGYFRGVDGMRRRSEWIGEVHLRFFNGYLVDGRRVRESYTCMVVHNVWGYDDLDYIILSIALLVESGECSVHFARVGSYLEIAGVGRIAIPASGRVRVHCAHAPRDDAAAAAPVDPDAPEDTLPILLGVDSGDEMDDEPELEAALAPVGPVPAPPDPNA